MNNATKAGDDDNVLIRRLNWQSFIFPIRTLWNRDKTYLLFFLVVNIVVGQIGLLTSLLLTLTNGGDLLSGWKENLGAAALYTFSISLVASSAALIGSEFLDAFRFKNEIRLSDQKVVWTLLAIAVVLLQAPLVGSLLSKSYTNNTQLAPITSSESLAQNQSKKATTIAESATTFLPIPTPPKLTIPLASHAIQIFFWLLSMFIALQLFCLSRIHLIPDGYAASRNAEVRTITIKAENQTKTTFDERL